MFLGEFLCLLAFKFIWYSTAQYRIERMTYEGDTSSLLVRYWPIRINKDIRLVEGRQEFTPLIFWAASILDLSSTCLSYLALNLTTASSFQMLRGSVMVFTAIFRWIRTIEMSDLMGFLFDRFSILFLKKRLTITQWFGILTAVSGLVVVGVSDLLFDKTPEGNHTALVSS